MRPRPQVKNHMQNVWFNPFPVALNGTKFFLK
jgi:hypothetical protein